MNELLDLALWVFYFILTYSLPALFVFLMASDAISEFYKFYLSYVSFNFKQNDKNIILIVQHPWVYLDNLILLERQAFFLFLKFLFSSFYYNLIHFIHDDYSLFLRKYNRVVFKSYQRFKRRSATTSFFELNGFHF